MRRAGLANSATVDADVPAFGEVSLEPRDGDNNQSKEASADSARTINLAGDAGARPRSIATRARVPTTRLASMERSTTSVFCMRQSRI